MVVYNVDVPDDIDKRLKLFCFRNNFNIEEYGIVFILEQYLEWKGVY